MPDQFKALCEKGKTPKQILSDLNKDMEERIREDMFIIGLTLAIIDIQLDKITYASQLVMSLQFLQGLIKIITIK